MEEIPSPKTMGCVFVEKYYKSLCFMPEEIYRFYDKSSVANWNAKDGATTFAGIPEMIMSSDFKDSVIEIEDIHSQNSLGGSLLVVVTGLSTGKDGSKRKFSHTFLLAKQGFGFSKQEVGFYVLNDILRFAETINLPKPSSHSATQTSINASSKPIQKIQVSDLVCVQEKPAPATKNVSVTTDLPKVRAEVVADKTQTRLEKTKSVLTTKTVSEIVSEVKEATPKPKASYLDMLSKEKTSSTPAPATLVVRVSELDGLPEEEKARLLALRNGSRKAMTLASKLPNVHAPKAIYVRGLPLDTTIDDLTDAVKVFGIVKKFDGVQVILHKDEYCFGFVHFQFADSAKAAVEAKVIEVKGEKVQILYKKRLGDGNGNESRGRSPSGRSGSQNMTPSSRGSSSNGYSSNGTNGEANPWNGQRGRNGYAYQRNGEKNDQKVRNGEQNDQRRRNGEAAQK